MKKVICLVFIFFYLYSLISVAADSLKQVLKSAEEEQQAEIMIQLATVLLRKSPEEAMQYAQKAERLSEKFQQSELGALALKLQGNYHYLNQDYPQALKKYQSGLLQTEKSNNNKLKADLYNNLGQSYTHIKNYKLALDNLQKSLSLRRSFPSRDDEISSLCNIGLLYWDWQNYAKSAQYYAAATKLLDKTDNPKLAASTYNNLGNALIKTGNSVDALAAFIRSLKIKESTGNQTDLANANANIGNLYYHTKEYHNAMEYYETAQEIYRETGDTAREAQIAGNLGVVYNKLQSYDRSLQQHQTALSEFRKKNMLADVAKTLNNIANVYKETKNFEPAIVHYQESIEIKNRLNDIEGLAISYYNIGEVRFAQGDYDAALENTLISLDAVKKINSQTMLRNTYQQLAKIYAIQKDFPKAYQALNSFVKLDHELYYTESRDVMAEMLVKYNTEEKTKEISQLKTEHQLQTNKLAEQIKQKIRLLIFLLLILVVACIMGILFNQKQREVKKRKGIQSDLELLNQDLECRVEQAIEKYHIQQQIITQKSKLEALGKLSAGIAHEINQPLSALSMSLDNLQMTEEKGKIESEYLGSKILTMQDDIQRIRQIIEHVRLFSRDQRDIRIEQIDVNATLLSSLSLLLNGLSKKDINIIKELSEEKLFTIGNHFKLEQVFVNLISNARDAIETKHNQGLYQDEKMTLILQTTWFNDQIVVTVEDNGCGIPEDMISQVFEPFHTTKDPDKGTGLGLSISYGIISEMQGSIEIESKLNTYTKIVISLPSLRSSNDTA